MPSSSVPERVPRKPTLIESVEDFIARKKTDQKAEGAREVQASAESVQREVAEVMAGAEKPKEELQEKGEKKGEQKGGGYAAQTTQSAEVSTAEDWHGVILPDETVMIKKIRTAITLQIKIEMKKARKFESSLTSGSAQQYSTTIARVRKLKSILASLWTATIDYVKDLYKKYFRPDGQSRNLEEISVD